MHSLLLLTLIITSYGALQQIDTCDCQHQAECFQYENQTLCDCGGEYLGADCSLVSKQINQSQQTFTTSHQLQYYYTQFNASSFYITQIMFCPINFEPNTLYTVSVGFQKADGSLHSDTDKISGYHNFTAINQNTCFSFSGPIFTPDLKYNRKNARFVAKLKEAQNTEDPNSTIEVAHKNTMKIFAIKLEYMYPSPLVIGQYMAGLSIFLLILSAIAFIACRKILLRRITHFQPAERVMDINHFDQLMPAVYNAQPEISTNTQANFEQDECMICLLGITETYTRTTPCRHLFHKDCIDEWGKKSLTCPACRHSLRPTHFHPI